MNSKEEVKQHPDNKIDQDFPGFPGGQSTEKIINPTTAAEKETADVDHTDGEKKLKSSTPNIDEKNSDGSASAFDATETVKE